MDIYWEAQWAISAISDVSNKTDEEELALDVLLKVK